MAPSVGIVCDCAIDGAGHQIGSRSRTIYRKIAFDLPHLDKTKKIRQSRFCTLILIAAVGMEPITAAARVGMKQSWLEVMLAEEPIEGTRCRCDPPSVAVRAPRGKAGRNRCCRLDRLLVKCFRLLAQRAKALGPYRPEASRRRSLERHEPA